MIEEMAKGKAVIMGRIEVLEEPENYKHDMAILVVFDDVEEIRKAISDGKLEFKLGT